MTSPEPPKQLSQLEAELMDLMLARQDLASCRAELQSTREALRLEKVARIDSVEQARQQAAEAIREIAEAVDATELAQEVAVRAGDRRLAERTNNSQITRVHL